MQVVLQTDCKSNGVHLTVVTKLQFIRTKTEVTQTKNDVNENNTRVNKIANIINLTKEKIRILKGCHFWLTLHYRLKNTVYFRNHSQITLAYRMMANKAHAHQCWPPINHERMNDDDW